LARKGVALSHRQIEGGEVLWHADHKPSLWTDRNWFRLVEQGSVHADWTAESANRLHARGTRWGIQFVCLFVKNEEVAILDRAHGASR
jgi:hypothetical protein